MNNKNKYLFVLIFFVCILSISAISATENTTDKEVIKTSNNKESNLETINYQDKMMMFPIVTRMLNLKKKKLLMRIGMVSLEQIKPQQKMKIH